MENDGDPLLGLQAPEAAFQLVAIGGGLAAVRLCRLELEDPDLCRARSVTPTLVGAGIHKQPMQPGIEPLGIAEVGQLSPGLDEGFLDCVLGQLESRSTRRAIRKRRSPAATARTSKAS